MSTELDPIVGNWYRHLDKGQAFQVVAVNETARTIELQHFDGDLEEIESDDWYKMTLEPAATPEDWTGPVDDVQRDDLGYTDTNMERPDWRKPLEENPGQAGESWEDSRSEDERDEWAEGTPTEDLSPQEEIEETPSSSPGVEEVPESEESQSSS